VGGQAWPLEKAQHRFRNQYLGQPTETYGLWAAIFKEEQRYIGCCGLRHVEGGKSAHLRYYFARPYWRRGFATEAAKGFVEVAFGRLALLTIVADVGKGNQASGHILQRLRFEYVSREEIPVSGRVILSYELSRGEWESS
jgi:RimJ/RimL family protein N-acetyltransferase